MWAISWYYQLIIILYIYLFKSICVINLDKEWVISRGRPRLGCKWLGVIWKACSRPSCSEEGDQVGDTFWPKFAWSSPGILAKMSGLKWCAWYLMYCCNVKIQIQSQKNKLIDRYTWTFSGTKPFLLVPETERAVAIFLMLDIFVPDGVLEIFPVDWRYAISSSATFCSCWRFSSRFFCNSCYCNFCKFHK